MLSLIALVAFGSAAQAATASTADWSIFDPLTETKGELSQSEERQDPPAAPVVKHKKKAKDKQKHRVQVDPEFLPLDLNEIYR